MVKKYPFSTKAAKAMIAATIAFTPVATTAGVFGADKVEAAAWHFNTKATLAEYANDIYDNATRKTEIEEVRAALESITTDGWKLILDPAISPDVEGDSQKEADLNSAIALLELQIGITLGSVTVADIDAVISATKDSFGFGDTPQAQVDAAYLAYLENVEAELKSLTDDSSNLSVATILTALKEADGNSGIKNAIAGVFTVTPDTATEVKNNLQSAITEGTGPNTDTSTIALALYSAFESWEAIYNQSPPGSGGGGGGVVTPPEPTPGEGEVTPPATPGAEVEVTPAIVTENNGNVTATIPQALQAQIVSAVTVQTPQVTVTLPQVTPGGAATIAIPGGLVQGILGVTQSASLVVVGPSGASINLPLGQLAGGFGSGFGSGTLNLTMKPATPSERTGLLSQVTNRLNGLGSGTGSASSETKAAALVGDVKMPAPATNVSISATISGQTVPVTTFGDIYIEREFPLTGAVDTNRTTGATIAADGTVKAIPTTFKTVEGTQFAVLKTLYNSADTYTVLETNQTFPDIDGGKNWAEKYIESLSSKFIISGTTAGTYKPDQDMTRSQFAFLLSRALGLPGTTAYDGRFSDVKGNEWFNANGEFMAAVQYGVIAGKTDGTFGADEKVTRAEAAAMIGRAMELGFIEFDKGQLDTSKTLAGFKDAKEIGASTRAEVLKVVQAGIMSGASNGEFNPNDYTKRDQMARILAEFLMKADLMQDIK